MKSLAIAALGALLLAFPASARISQDPTPSHGLALIETPAGPILSSATSVEPLLAETDVALAPDRTLCLTPGIRFTRTGKGCSLSTHDGRKIEIGAGRDRLTLPSPVIARLSERGWEFGAGTPYAGARLSARPQPAEEIAVEPPQSRPQSRPVQGKKKLRVRWLYSEDPMATDEIFNTPAIQQLVHLSPIGF